MIPVLNIKALEPSQQCLEARGAGACLEAEDLGGASGAQGQLQLQQAGLAWAKTRPEVLILFLPPPQCRNLRPVPPPLKVFVSR